MSVPITISAKDFKLTPSIKAYVEEKLSKLERFHSGINRIGVELDVDHSAHRGLIHRVEVWVYMPGRTVKAGVKAEHMREAIDLVYPKLERQLVKSKERDHAHQPRPDKR